MGILDTDIFYRTKPTESGRYFFPGAYLVQIAKTALNPARNGEAFVIEAYVWGTNSQHPDAPRPGETASQVWTTGGNKEEIAMSTWLSFLCACYGLDGSALDAEQWRYLSRNVLAGNMLVGTMHKVEVWEKAKKNSPGIFTMHKWLGPATPQQYAEFGFAS